MVPYSTVSVTNLIEGCGGKIYSFWAIYSLRISFCIVPPKLALGIPLFSAFAIYIAQVIAAGEFIVIEVVTLSKGISSNKIDMSSKLLTPTPHSPNSPAAIGESLSYPYSVGKSNAVLSPV